MAEVTINIVSRKDRLPELTDSNFFHSSTLFNILYDVPHVSPFMVTATDSDGRIIANILAVVRSNSFILPYIIRHGHIFGEGFYESDEDKGVIFKLMTDAATEEFKRRHCLYVEISGISNKMFGYGSLRRMGYFPVRWVEIHNSLHGKSPASRLLPVRRKRILKASAAGVRTYEVNNDDTFVRFYRLLKNFYSSKLHRYSPHIEELKAIGMSNNGRMYVTRYKEKIIGGCICINSGGDSYLWHIATKRKTYPTLFPTSQLIWHALEDAHQNDINHFNFMDVGIPFGKSPYRDFILSFGGKPVSSYRWFRCSFSIVNRFFSKILTS